MAKATEHPIPATTLDKVVARLALLHARELMAAGASPEEAATLACRGSWSQWRDWVLARLKESDS